VWHFPREIVSYNLENMVIFCLRVCISIQRTNQNLKAEVTILKSVNTHTHTHTHTHSDTSANEDNSFRNHIH